MCPDIPVYPPNDGISPGGRRLVFATTDETEVRNAHAAIPGALGESIPLITETGPHCHHNCPHPVPCGGRILDLLSRVQGCQAMAVRNTRGRIQVFKKIMRSFHNN